MQTAKSSCALTSQFSSHSQLHNKSDLSINSATQTTHDYCSLSRPLKTTPIVNYIGPTYNTRDDIPYKYLPASAQLTFSSSDNDSKNSDSDLVVLENEILESASKTDALIANILPNSAFSVQRMNLKHATIDKTIEDTIKSTWHKIIGNNFDILISYINNVSDGLGISLEGTVDVDDITGLEDKPRHYLRTIVADGPIGLDGSFKPGDELLEANGKKLYGVPYFEVLSSLKTLPNRVQIVVARRKEVDVSQLSRSSSTMLYDDFYDYEDDESDEYDDEDNDGISIDVDYDLSNQIDKMYNNWGFGNSSVLCRNDTAMKYQIDMAMKNAFEDNLQFYVLSKAKSDHSIFASSTSCIDFEPLKSMTRNRSLQYLRDVAMWSGPILVELNKESQGLGFSIDYYQDASSDVPVIVISSLVPNGVAHLDGRIIPGDRLLFINEVEIDSLGSKTEVIDILQSLPKGKVLLGFAKPMFPSGYMYRSYSKETLDELSTSQSLDYEPITLSQDPTLNSTYNSLQRAIKSDVKLYQISTCVVQQALHYAALYLRDNNDILVLVPCSSELSDKDINSQLSVKEECRDIESTFMQNSSSTASTPKREISPISNKSDPNLNLINYKALHSPDFNLFKDLNASFSTVKSDGESFNKLRLQSELTSSNTVSSDINTSSSIDCLDDLEVTKISESDTDAMVHYWRNSIKSEGTDTLRDSEIDVDSLKKWFDWDVRNHNVLELETTKWCGIGYRLMNSPLARYTSSANGCSSGDIITDINNQKMSLICPDSVAGLLSNLRNAKTPLRIGYIPSKELLISETLLPMVSEVKDSIPAAQRVYACSLSDCNDNDHRSQTNDEVSPPKITLTDEKYCRQDNIHIVGWTEPRSVVLVRESNQSLGISILGGKVANVIDAHGALNECNLVSGIFLTNIAVDSPAERCGELNIGDRLLSVNGNDLTSVSYEDAITHIRSATSPITFTVQSLVESNMSDQLDIIGTTNHPKSIDSDSHEQEPISVYQTERINDIKKLATPPNSPEKIPNTCVLAPGPDDKPDSVSISSLSNESFTQDVSDFDNPRSDDKGDVKEIRITMRDDKGLGLLLVGNKDCCSMNCYVCGFKENSVAAIDGQLMIGDELLKINDTDLAGMSHSNVAPIIKRCQTETETISLIIRRNQDNSSKMACIPALPMELVDLADKVEYNTNMAGKEVEDEKQEANEAVNDDKPSDTKVQADLNLEGFGTIYNIHLQKTPQGFGFFIMDGNSNDEPGIYVKKVTVGGIAANEGTLKEGDRILLINNEVVIKDHYDSVLRKLRGCKESLDMVVGRITAISSNYTVHRSASIDMHDGVEYDMIIDPPPLQNNMVTSPILNIIEDRKTSYVRASISHDVEPIYSSIAPNRKKSSATRVQVMLPVKKVSVIEEKPPLPTQQRTLNQKEHPTKAQIVPGVATVIELTKDRGLGLSIVGGCDTILGTVLIHEVHEKEAAALDGRMWAGDQILAVNGKDLRNASHDQAIQALRSVGNRVRLKILRDKLPLCDNALYSKIKVDLMKKSKKGLGIAIVSKADVGVCISDLVKGSVADQDHRLQKNDLILEINDTNVRSFTQDQVAALLKRCSGKVSLTIGRLRSKVCSPKNGESSEKDNKKKK